jgi:hypothetical protein
MATLRRRPLASPLRQRSRASLHQRTHRSRAAEPNSKSAQRRSPHADELARSRSPRGTASVCAMPGTAPSCSPRSLSPLAHQSAPTTSMYRRSSRGQPAAPTQHREGLLDHAMWQGPLAQGSQWAPAAKDSKAQPNHEASSERQRDRGGTPTPPVASYRRHRCQASTGEAGLARGRATREPANGRPRETIGRDGRRLILRLLSPDVGQPKRALLGQLRCNKPDSLTLSLGRFKARLE